MIAAFASLIAIAFSLFFPEQANAWACPVFMSSVLILGMPHGTVDPLLLFSKKRASKWLKINSRVPWIVAYFSLAIAYATGWQFSPLFCLGLFLLLTAFHWGTSEYTLDSLSYWHWAALGLTRGGVIVLGVLAFQRADSIDVMRLVTGMEPIVPSGLVLQALLVGNVIAHVVFLALAFEKNHRELLIRMIDSLMILLLLAFTPALLGMGVYYMFFHAVRYYDFFREDRTFLFKSSHLLSGFALLLVLALATGLYSTGINFLESGALPTHFMLLAALTLPHAILVTRLQQRRSLPSLAV